MWSTGTKKNESIQIIKEHRSHQLRLHSMKSRINNAPPKKVLHLEKKLKTKAIKEEINQTIQVENQLLLQKMISISSRKSNFSQIRESSSVKSLNLNTRAQELLKITEENKKMLSRLTDVKSNYSMKRWEEDFQYKKYLSHQVSENSRRMSNPPSIFINESTRTPVSRPDTGFKFQRPSTAVAGRRSYLDL